jgi:hypothetical protein
MSLGDDVINVIIGVIGSLLSLWLLFSIKPSLRLTWEVGFRSTKWWKRLPDEWYLCSRSGLSKEKPPTNYEVTCQECETTLVHYRVEIENLGLGKVADLESRLWRIRKRSTLGNRDKIELKNSELLELNGKWREAWRTGEEITGHVGDRFYHFFIPCEVSKEPLGADEYYLLQVWSRHGFTNFGRVHKLRINASDADPSERFSRFKIENPDARRRRSRAYATVATLIATVFASRASRRATTTRKQDAKNGPPLSG